MMLHLPLLLLLAPFFIIGRMIAGLYCVRKHKPSDRRWWDTSLGARECEKCWRRQSMFPFV
jgi:hypothetical protein